MVDVRALVAFARIIDMAVSVGIEMPVADAVGVDVLEDVVVEDVLSIAHTPSRHS